MNKVTIERVRAERAESDAAIYCELPFERALKHASGFGSSWSRGSQDPENRTTCVGGLIRPGGVGTAWSECTGCSRCRIGGAL